MNTAQDAISIARSQLGVQETAINRVIYWDEIGRSDLQGQPWCAAFVTWVMKKAGVPFPTIDTPGGYVYCPNAVSYGYAHGELVSYPRPGDIALFDWQRDSIADHTGIVVQIYGSTSVQTIEGNADDCVEMQIRPLGEVLAFFRPPYSSAVPSGSIPVTVQTPLTPITFIPRRHTMLDSVPNGGIIAARPDGAVDCFEGARFFGSMSGKKMNAPIVGIAATSSGNGYWLLGEDGGVFCFGDALWQGPLLKYVKQWSIGLGTQSPFIGIRRGSGDKEYVLVTDNPTDTQARLYHIPKNGQFAS